MSLRIGAPLASGAGFPTAPQIKAATYTAVANDFVRVDATGGPVTITLPNNPQQGATVSIQKYDATGNVVTVLPAGGGSIQGDPNALIKAQWAGGVLQHWGGNVWAVVSQFAAGGAPGATGPQGIQGIQGIKGDTGVSGVYAPIRNAQTASYTLVLSDAQKFVTVDTTTPATLTIPTNANAAIPVNTLIEGAQLGTGQLTIAGQAGVTLLATPGLKVLDRYGTFGMYKLLTDTWLVYGRLSA